MEMISTQKGFTLIEVLVAVFVFIIGVAALTNILLTTINGNRLGNQETQASMIAHDKLEELRGISPSSFGTDPRLAPGPHPVGLVTSFGGMLTGAKYTLSYVVTNVPTTNGSLFYANPKNVDVTVIWNNPSPHSVTISSMLIPNI